MRDLSLATGLQGYFKWPDPAYSCRGVKQLFSMIEAAAYEIERDLSSREEQPHFAITAWYDTAVRNDSGY
jgi:hypothetical protein